jgi:uncharacterized protein YciI
LNLDLFSTWRFPISKRFVFFYLFKVSPERLMEVVPRHRDYWDDVGPAEYTGGPFTYRDGGMILFSAGSLAEAERTAQDDSFVTEGFIDQMWVKEWEVMTTRVPNGRE